MDNKINIKLLKFSSGLAPYRDKSGLWGYIDEIGTIKVKPTFEKAFPFSDGMAGVSEQNNHGSITGYLDDKLDLIRLDSLNHIRNNQFHNGYCISPKGYIDKECKLVKELKNFDPITNFTSDSIAVAKDKTTNERVIITNDGTRINTEIHFFISNEFLPFSNGVYLYQRGFINYDYGYYVFQSIDEGFVQLFSHKLFDTAINFGESYAIAKKKRSFWNRKPKSRLIDKTGSSVNLDISKWNHFNIESNEFIKISNSRRNKVNYLNTKSKKYLFPNDMDDLGHDYYNFNDNMMRVKNPNKKIGYYDKNGDLVLDCIYDEGDDFCNGFACVKVGDNFIYINKEGEEVYKF